MIKKLMLTFDEHTVLESSVSVFVKKFDLEPNILKAQIDDGLGTMIVEVKGDEKKINDSVKYFISQGIDVKTLNTNITRDHSKCFSCGACTSVCITKALLMDEKTFEVHVHPDKCIACGDCVTACPVKALKIDL